MRELLIHLHIMCEELAPEIKKGLHLFDEADREEWGEANLEELLPHVEENIRYVLEEARPVIEAIMKLGEAGA